MVKLHKEAGALKQRGNCWIKEPHINNLNMEQTNEISFVFLCLKARLVWLLYIEN